MKENSSNPNIFTKEERYEYHSFINSSSKDSTLDEVVGIRDLEDSEEANITLSMPTFNLFVELMLVRIFNRTLSSVDQFYSIIFTQSAYEDSYDNEELQGQNQQVSMESLKEYYQQYCYWNMFDEEDLYSERNIKMLHMRGFKVKDTDEEVPVLKKLLIIKFAFSPQLLSEMNVSDYRSSLHAFIEHACIQTNYESDEVNLNLFQDQYELFCNLFEIEQVSFDLNYLKREFQIDSAKKKVNQIERINRSTDLTLTHSSSSASLRKDYKLNLNNIVEYLNILKGNNFSDRILEREKGEIAMHLVFPKYWWLIDIVVALAVYIILFALNNFFSEHIESRALMMSNFKRIPESQRLRDFNPFTVEGDITIESIYTDPLTWHTFARIAFLIVPLALSTIATLTGKDISNYYYTNQKRVFNLLNDGTAYLQWFLVLASLFLFTWSILQYITGTIVYCLTKIYALLPYVVSSLCFVGYVAYFYYTAKKSNNKKLDEIKSELKSVMINKCVERLRHASSYNSEMQKAESLKQQRVQGASSTSLEPLSEKEVLFTVSQSMKELRDICMIPETWCNFIEGALLSDKQLMQSALADIVEKPPINLPAGSYELLIQILNMEDHMETPEMFVSVMSSIIVKIMVNYEQFFIKDLKLRDLEVLKTCNCDEETLLDKDFVCSRCRQTPLYEKNKNEIRRLAVEKNTYIFLLLITLIDNIRKKETSKILDILIEKIIPEGLVDREPLSSLMKLAYKAFFDIDQNFNRLDWAKCINDVLGSFFKDDQIQITIINMLDEAHNDNAFDTSMSYIDHADNINIIKRSVVGSTSQVKGINGLSHFLSFITIFLGKEPMVPDKLLKDLLQFLNKDMKFVVSLETLKVVINYLNFSRETPKSIFNKITMNAEKHFLDQEISKSIKDIKSIASGLSKEIKTKDFQNIEGSQMLLHIRNALNLQSYEMMGLVYLVNDRVDNDEVSKFFRHIFAINNYQKYENTLLDMIAIAVSKDPFKLTKAIERLKLKYDRVFLYLRDVASQEALSFDSETKEKDLQELFVDLPPDIAGQSEINNRFVRGLKDKDLAGFFQSYLPKSEANYDASSLSDSKWRNLKVLELIWALNSEEKLTDILVKFKFFFRELDDPLFFTFVVKIYTVLEYLQKKKRLNVDFTIAKNKAGKVLADLIFTKVENMQKFLELFVSDRTEDFIDALCYFNEDCRTIKEVNGKSLKNHIQYIDKSLKFLQAQIEFYSTNPTEPPGAVAATLPKEWKDEFHHGRDNLGVIIVKKIMMPEINLKHSQIMQLLGSIIAKIFNNEAKSSKREAPRIMKFFTSLFVYVLGDNNSDLGEYFFHDHKESFIRTLVNCRGSKSRSQRINILFEDLYYQRTELLETTLTIYFVMFLRNKINRDEFNLREAMEHRICSNIGVQAELFDFLDVLVTRNKLKFKNMLMTVHWKLLKLTGGQNSFKKDDVDWEKLYENVIWVMADNQPNLGFFSEFLKVPYSRLNCLYILNNLRRSSRVDKVLNDANTSFSFKELMELLNIDHTELVQILKICLNKVSYECLAILVKKIGMNDKIDIDMLMCILTIDAQLMVDIDETRNLYKRMNLYWKLFKPMGIDKDLTWAFIRILKGDMYSFKKFISNCEVDVPPTHKRFMNIVVALCGCKNSPYVMMHKERKNLTLIEACQKFYELKNDFKRKKENSKEGAQVFLWEQMSIHPLWGILEHQAGLKLRQTSEGILNLENHRVFDMKKIRDRVDMWMFHLMNSIIRLGVEDLEHFVNLSFFHDILKVLKGTHVTNFRQDVVVPVKGAGDTVGADNQTPNLLLPRSQQPDAINELEKRRECTIEAEQRLNGLRDYYSSLFEGIVRRFKDNILKKFKVDFEYRKDCVDYAMFTDLCEDVHQDLASKNFFSSINPILLENWFKYRAKKGRNKAEIGISDEEFEKRQAEIIESGMSVAVYSFFSGADNRSQPKPVQKPKQAKFKDVTQRGTPESNPNGSPESFPLEARSNTYVDDNPSAIFKAPAAYEDFLDSVVDLILNSMSSLNHLFMSQNKDTSASARNSDIQMEDLSFDQGIEEGSADERLLETDQGSLEEGDEENQGNPDEPAAAPGQEDIREDPAQQKTRRKQPSLFEMLGETNKHENVSKTMENRFYTTGIMEFSLYSLLRRLRKSTRGCFEDKMKNSEHDFKKIDMLFNTLEKIAMFNNRSFGGFRKSKYMTMFSFSMGNILEWQKRNRCKYSLYAPELHMLSLAEANEYNLCDLNTELDFNFDIKDFLGRAHMIKRVVEYDALHLCYMSPFSFYSFEIDVEYTNNYPFENPTNIDYYFSPCILNVTLCTQNDARKLFSSPETRHLLNVMTSDQHVDPEFISLYFIRLGLYHFFEDPKPRWARLNQTQRKDLLPRKGISSSGFANDKPSEFNFQVIQQRTADLYFLDSSKEPDNAAIANLDTVSPQAKYHVSQVDMYGQIIDSQQAIKSKSSTISPKVSEFFRGLNKLRPFIFMLNDLALGYFKVLNETQNVLSNDPQYSKYQHIYEAILKLQHISKVYDPRILKESLDSLSPYLASDRIKLHSIVDYILNTNSSKTESSKQSL